MNLQLIQNQSTLQPKKGSQRNQYVGPLHPQTKKRHGKGNYQYKNKFFEYDGEYVQGKKQGLGKLKMKDGTIIQATFVEDEITGKGKITYPDGSTYSGQFLFGQKNGHGRYESIFEIYQGQWKQNAKQGNGKLQILSRGQIFEGEFHRNKLHGKGTLKSFNYSYNGQWNEGKKQGYGEEINDWRRIDEDKQQSNNQDTKLVDNNKDLIQYSKRINYSSYIYQGKFTNNLFHSHGKYISKTSTYIYQGQFCNGLPISKIILIKQFTDYPNCFRVFVSSNQKDETGKINQTQKVLINDGAIIDYQLEGESKNIYVCVFCDQLQIETVYQGPDYLDDKQPTEQQIQQMIKNWQIQNKKNKNPPSMPDFRAPKMKKPQLLLIRQQNHRQIQLTLQRQSHNEDDNKMKIDYREQILQRRMEIEKIKQEQKKNEQDDPKKKGMKKEVKNQSQLKVNVYKESPKRKEKVLKLETIEGGCVFRGFQLPDDFPQGRYVLRINSQIKDFGLLQPRRIQFLVKTKQPVGKKK